MHLRARLVRLLALAAFMTAVMLAAFPSTLRADDHYPDDAVVAETDGITGVYGYDQSGYRVEIKDGRHVMWDIRKPPPEYIWFTPVGENYFSAEMFGEPAEISFSGDDRGHATEMFIKMQDSNDFKLPLEEIGQSRYSTVFNGNPVELKFSTDDDGQAFAVTIIQGDREMKISRQEAGES
jgi:hypothetical protein